MITNFPIGIPGGQQPAVFVKDITNDLELFGKNQDQRSVFPASCVKMMTLLLAWEHKADVWTTETVTITTADISGIPAGISVAGLVAGNVLTWESLAYALMLPSGGDAALAIARVIGGTVGVSDFVAMMNDKANLLGMNDSGFYDPYGGSKTFGPDVTKNYMSPRDMTILAEALFEHQEMRDLCGTVSKTINIGGSNTKVLNNVIKFDANCLAAKTGVWTVSNQYNMCMLWNDPDGNDIIISIMGSSSEKAMYLDMHGIMYAIGRGYNELADSHIDNVQLLLNSEDDSDASPAGRTLVSNIVNFDDGLMVVTNSNVYVADDSALRVGSGDMCVELYYSGEFLATTGSLPGPNVEYLFAAKGIPGNREWVLNCYNNAFNIFCSSDGINWTSVVAVQMTAADAAVFFNGAIRHIALVKHGSEVSLYLNGEKQAGIVSMGTIAGRPVDLHLVQPGFADIGIIRNFRVTMGVARYVNAIEPISGANFSEI